MTIGKQRLLVTENALLLEPGQRSGGEEVVGLRLGLDEESAGPFPPPRRSKLSRFTRPSGIQIPHPRPVEPSTAPDLKIILNQSMTVVSGA